LSSAVTISNTGVASGVLTTSPLSPGIWLLTYQAVIYCAIGTTVTDFITFLANSSTAPSAIISDNNANALSNIAKMSSGTQLLPGSNNVVGHQSSSAIVSLSTSTSITLWFSVTGPAALKASGADTSATQHTYIQTIRIA